MQKIKAWIESEKGKDILVILVVILVGLASFGLGRLSKEGSGGGLRVEYKDQAGNMAPVANALVGIRSLEMNSMSVQNSLGNFFASTRGKKYYPANCSAGKSLKPENRIYFDTREEAEGQGYELSSSCR